MPLYYRLGNPGVSSISHDGREHPVNPDGLLEVAEAHATPGFVQQITGQFAGTLQNPDDAPAALSPDEQERQILFARLDIIYNRRVDRRHSVQQLRKLLADHEARQARTVGATTALNTGVVAEPDPAP